MLDWEGLHWKPVVPLISNLVALPSNTPALNSQPAPRPPAAPRQRTRSLPLPTDMERPRTEKRGAGPDPSYGACLSGFRPESDRNAVQLPSPHLRSDSLGNGSQPTALPALQPLQNLDTEEAH